MNENEAEDERAARRRRRAEVAAAEVARAAAVVAVDLKDAEDIREGLGHALVRNGRLATNWFSRRQTPRWRMLRVDDVFYDRERLREFALERRPVRRCRTDSGAAQVCRGEIVPPGGRRALTDAELAELAHPSPWSPARRMND